MLHSERFMAAMFERQSDPVRVLNSAMFFGFLPLQVAAVCVCSSAMLLAIHCKARVTSWRLEFFDKIAW